jgi:hypothetical protein
MIARLRQDSASNDGLTAILNAVQNDMLVISEHVINPPGATQEGRHTRKAMANIARDLGADLPPLVQGTGNEAELAQ